MMKQDTIKWRKVILQMANTYPVYADLILNTIASGQYGFTKYLETPYTENSFSQSSSVADSNGDGVWLVLHAVVV